MKIRQFLLIASSVASLLCFGTEALAANVALSGIATQSSIDIGGGSSGFADKGIDGDRNGDFYGGGSVTHTFNGDPDPAADLFEWWEVKLDHQYPIGQIKVFNRTDCCSERLIPFRLTVYDGATPVYSQDVTAFVADITGPNISGMTFNLSGQVGDRVRVQLLHQDFLSLAEVEVFEGQQNEYEVSVTAFIPGNNMSAFPRSCFSRPQRRLLELYIKADDRSFDPDATTYRVRQKVTVIPDQSSDPDGIKDGTEEILPQDTRIYASDALPTIDANDEDGVPGDCHLFHGSAAPVLRGMQITSFWTGPQQVQVELRGNAGMGAAPGVSRLCDISWNVILEIDASANPTTVKVRGQHDGFPAYDVYVNNLEIYTFWPGPLPYNLSNLRKLCGTMEETIPPKEVILY